MILTQNNAREAVYRAPVKKHQENACKNFDLITILLLEANFFSQIARRAKFLRCFLAKFGGF